MSATMPLTFRGIAAIASLLWLFTRDVDIVPLEDPSNMYLVLGKGRRGVIRPEDLAVCPTALKKKASRS